MLKDDGSLRDLGLGALGSAVLGFGVARQSDPGEVVANPGVASDSLLTDERGYGLIELAVGLLILVVALILLLRLVA